MKKIITIITIIFFVSCGMVYAEGYTNASVKGKWAVTTITGANNAASIGLLTADENGAFTGSGILNAPGLFMPRRERIETTFSGTYDVNPDGSGTLTNTFTTNTGMSVTIHMDVIVTKAEVVDGVKVATELAGFYQEPGTFMLEGKLGLMTTFTATRLPD